MTDQYDVVVVGASIAGCTAATLLARQGARVALVESRSELDAHKALCTHYIQPSATRTIQRLGLAEKIEAAGGIRNHFNMWTSAGWAMPPRRDFGGAPGYGYSLRRSVLDPIVRSHAAETPGVDLMLGRTARELLRDGSRVAGVVIANGATQVELRATLTVAADGRHSRVAAMANSKTKARKNGRFGYFAHYRGVTTHAPPGDAQMWLLDPAVMYSFPNDDGVVLLAAMLPKSDLSEFKTDLEGNLIARFADLHNGPDMSKAERVSAVQGVTEMPNLRRRPAQPGLAFIGDAARAADPLWGIGCGWAFQSAEWLADAVENVLTAGDDATIDRALKSYAKTHRRQLAAHDFFISSYSTGRKLNPIERLMFSAAVHDEDLAHHVHAFGSRVITPRQFLTPNKILHAIKVRRAHASAAESGAR